MYTSFPWHWKESFVKKSTTFYACDHVLNSHKPNALFGSDTMYRYCTGSWVQIPYRPEFFRPYFHYCSSSVHYCKDCLHIQFFICSSLFFFSYLQSVFLKWEIRYTVFYSYCAGYPKYLQQRLTGEIRGWEMQKDL